MQNVKGNLWTYDEDNVDARCVTTNGMFVPEDRLNSPRAIMGGGCARECVERFPWTPYTLGRLLKERGNHVYDLAFEAAAVDGAHPLHVLGFAIVTFPTIEQLGHGANLDTIGRSCEELMALVNTEGWQNVILPRPGVGLGNLSWSEVEPFIAERLDDRIKCITF